MKQTRPNRLKHIAQMRGCAVIDLIKEALVKEGSKMGAARCLGVAPGTIDYHLNKAKLRFEIRHIVTFSEVTA